MTKALYLETYGYLNENEAEVLSLKDTDQNFVDIASQMGITKSRVAQIYNKAKRKIEMYGAVEIKFFDILSIESLDLSESIKNTLIKSEIYTIPNLFIVWKSGRLNNINGLGKSGIDKILEQLYSRSLCIKKSNDEYIPYDINGMDCKLFLLSEAGISNRLIRKEIFGDKISTDVMKNFLFTAALNCKKCSCEFDGCIEELLLPIGIECILKRYNVKTINDLIKSIKKCEIYNMCDMHDARIIFNTLDRVGYGEYLI